MLATADACWPPLWRRLVAGDGLVAGAGARGVEADPGQTRTHERRRCNLRPGNRRQRRRGRRHRRRERRHEARAGRADIMVAHASSGETGSMITCDVSAMVKPRDVSVRCSGECAVASVSRRAIGPWSSDRRPRVGCATGVASLRSCGVCAFSYSSINVHVHLYACNILRALRRPSPTAPSALALARRAPRAPRARGGRAGGGAWPGAGGPSADRTPRRAQTTVT